MRSTTPQCSSLIKTDGRESVRALHKNEISALAGHINIKVPQRGGLVFLIGCRQLTCLLVSAAGLSLKVSLFSAFSRETVVICV
jgi:hypothetical protein